MAVSMFEVVSVRSHYPKFDLGETISMPKILLERGDLPMYWSFKGDLFGMCCEGWGRSPYQIPKPLKKANDRAFIEDYY
jgi:hypothetical protein